MLYAVGHQETYDASFRDKLFVMKRGKDSEYVGGWVWRSFKIAKRNLRPGFNVYGVYAKWKEHTEAPEKGGHHTLLRTAPMVQLDQNTGDLLCTSLGKRRPPLVMAVKFFGIRIANHCAIALIDDRVAGWHVNRALAELNRLHADGHKLVITSTGFLDMALGIAKDPTSGAAEALKEILQTE